MKAFLFILLVSLTGSAQASSLPSGGIAIVAGSSIAQVLEALGDPEKRIGGFGCDCGGCRTEEQLYYRQGTRNLTITVIDGRVTRID